MKLPVASLWSPAIPIFGLALLVFLPAIAAAQTLQAEVNRAMDGRSGTAVVLSVESGKILAAYHPQLAAQRAVLPGSAIKPFVLLELLRSGKVAAQTEWVCRRRVRIGSRNLDCQHVRTVEAMNAERALAYSCNSYFTEMGARLTDAELTAAFRRAGFFTPTGLLAEEAAGGSHPAADRSMLRLKSVGEDGIAVTPVQMAVAYRRLARPSRTADEAAQTVVAGLQAAVKYGTAQGAQVDGVDVAGKTGTATAEEGPWTHAWFAGFAPAARPEVVMVVFLERGHGSAAAEIAGEVLKAWTRRRR